MERGRRRTTVEPSSKRASLVGGFAAAGAVEGRVGRGLGVDADDADTADVEGADHDEVAGESSMFEPEDGAFIDREDLFAGEQDLGLDGVAGAGEPADVGELRVEGGVDAVVVARSQVDRPGGPAFEFGSGFAEDLLDGVGATFGLEDGALLDRGDGLDFAVAGRDEDGEVGVERATSGLESSNEEGGDAGVALGGEFRRGAGLSYGSGQAVRPPQGHGAIGRIDGSSEDVGTSARAHELFDRVGPLRARGHGGVGGHGAVGGLEGAVAVDP